MAEPRSQKVDARPITFALLRNGGVYDQITLTIRPEELTRESPSRTQAHQTLAAAWVDSFGRGMSMITISGHTGWRGNAAEDGLLLFQNLRGLVYDDWHDLRAQAQASGLDPDTAVELILVDALNEYSVVVAPLVFRLQRSRSRPLLAQYRIQMAALRDAAEPIAPRPNELLAVDHPEILRETDVATDALSETASRQRALAMSVRDTLSPAYHTVATLADRSGALLDQVNSVVDAGIATYQAVTAPAIAVAREVQRASRNLVQALVQPLAIADLHRQTIQELGSAFGEAYCNLRNNFGAVSRYFDFDLLYGASNCSSTIGGRPQTPYFDQNPFLDLYDGTPAKSTLTPDAADVVRVAIGDPLSLRDLGESELLALTGRLAAGIVT